MLILTPAKNVEEMVVRYFANLRALTYPRNQLSLGIIVSDSLDKTFEQVPECAPPLTDGLVVPYAKDDISLVHRILSTAKFTQRHAQAGLLVNVDLFLSQVRAQFKLLPADFRYAQLIQRDYGFMQSLDPKAPRVRCCQLQLCSHSNKPTSDAIPSCVLTQAHVQT